MFRKFLFITAILLLSVNTYSAPICLTISIDTSGSAKNVLEEFKQIAPSFIEEATEAGDTVNFVIFDKLIDQKVFVITDDNKDQMISAIKVFIENLEPNTQDLGTDLYRSWNYMVALSNASSKEYRVIMFCSDGYNDFVPSPGNVIDNTEGTTNIYFVGYTDPEEVLMKKMTGVGNDPIVIPASDLTEVEQRIRNIRAFSGGDGSDRHKDKPFPFWDKAIYYLKIVVIGIVILGVIGIVTAYFMIKGARDHDERQGSRK